MALVKALEQFDSDDWYLGCVSTPRTILADLKGRPTRTVPYVLLAGGVVHSRRIPHTPEMVLLGKIRKREYAL